MSLFVSFVGRYLRRDARRSVTTAAGMALGIAVVIGIRLANAGSVSGFEAALDLVSGRASLEILSTGGAIDERRLADLAWLRAYGDVSPIIDVEAAIRSRTRPLEAVRVLGVDILRDRPLRDYRVTREHEAETIAAADFLSLLIEGRALVLTERFARRHDIEIGDEVELVSGDRVAAYRVSGLLGDEGPARALDGSFVLMDVAVAQLAFDRLGWIDRVDLRLFDEIAVAEAEQAIAARLPAGLFVQRPERRTEQVEKMLAAFQFNLAALSYIALLVGLFLVYNTVTVSVITRRSEIGMLRAIGATRGTVVRLFLAEALALGCVGCLLGVPLGWLLAHGAVGLTSTTINVLYVASAAVVPPLSWTDVGLSLAIGLPLAMAAATRPAFDAARVAPVEAVARVTPPTRFRLARRLLVLPLLLLIVAGWLATRGPVGGLPVFGLASALTAVLGAALSVPALLTGWQRIGRPFLARVWPGEGPLAHANFGAAIPRLSISVAALAVSLSMLVAITVMIGSFRETVVYWVGQTLQADLYISAGGRPTAGSAPTISADAEQRIAAHPDVVAVDSFRSVDIPFGDGLVTVGAGRLDVVLAHGHLLFKSPRDGGEAIRRAATGEAVIVSESFAFRFDKDVGDRVELTFAGGPRSFAIAGIYYDYSSDRGIIVMDREPFERYLGERRPNGLTVYLREGADPETTRDDLRAALPSGGRLFIQTNQSLRREVLRIFDATFSITYALEGIAVLVALLGIAGTLVTLTLERRRDFTILKLVGAGRRQVRRVVLIEALILGGVSQALGLLMGTLLSLILIYVINVQSFGWTIQFRLPVVFLIQMSLLVLAATAVAALYPARLASRFEIGELGHAE